MKKYIIILLQLLISSSLYSQPLVLVSGNIKPYIETYEGIKEYFNGEVQLRFSENEPKDIFIYSPWFVIGDKAFNFAQKFNKNKKTVFALVKNPQKKITKKNSDLTGYRLNFSPKLIAEKINNLFSNGKNYSIGIPYNPKNNYYYVKKIIKKLSANFTIIEIPVSSDKELVASFEEIWNKINLILLIPDDTVINKDNINYIFSQALSKKIGIIGYNRWFVKRGAVFSYFIDYKELGKDTAKLYKKHKNGQILYYNKIKTIGNKLILEKYNMQKIEDKLDLLWQQN